MFLPWLGGGVELFISLVHYYSTTLLNMRASLGGVLPPTPLPTTANRHRDTTHTRNKPGNIKPKTPTQTKNTKATHTHNTHTRHTKTYQLTQSDTQHYPGRQ